MSSNLRIVKMCAFCKQEFIARKTTTETCSDPCAKRFYIFKWISNDGSITTYQTKHRKTNDANNMNFQILLLLILPVVGEDLREGKSFRPCEFYPGIIEGYYCYFVTVDLK